MICKFWAGTTEFFILANGISMDFARHCYRTKPRVTRVPSLIALLNLAIFQSFIGFWAKIRLRNIPAYSESNPGKSSRSKSTTYPTVLRLENLREVQSNSTATSDASAQKTWNQSLAASLAWFWIDCNQRFAVTVVANEIMKSKVWKPSRDLQVKTAFQSLIDTLISYEQQHDQICSRGAQI